MTDGIVISRRSAGIGGALIVAAVVGSAVVSARLSRGRQDNPKLKEKGEAHEEGRVDLSPEALKNADLEIVVAGQQSVTSTLELPGELSLNANALAHVTPRIGGTVREVKKQLGDVVKKGDVLAVLESRDYASLQTDVKAAKERLSLADSTYKREEKLWQEKVSAEKDYLAAKNALALAKVDYEAAVRKLSAVTAQSNSTVNGYPIVASMDGSIIERHIGVGEVLAETTKVFTIANLSTVWVNVAVYAKDLSRVAVGQTATVRSEGIETTRTGTIDFVGQVVGEPTRAAAARIVLKDPGTQWKPGLFVTASIVLDEAKVPVAIYSDAVQMIEQQPVVFVADDKGFVVRHVKIGRGGQAGDRRVLEVVDGLTAGEKYVAKNSFVLKSQLLKGAGDED